MWEIFLATVLSLSVGVREPRNVSTAPFDYELSYKLENKYKDLDLSFKHDYEREDGDYFNDIRAELNYIKNNIVLKEDYKQIASKNLYQFNSDIRYQWKGFSVGYGFIWDLKDEYKYSPSAGTFIHLENPIHWFIGVISVTPPVQGFVPSQTPILFNLPSF